LPNLAFGVGGDAIVFPEEEDNIGEDLMSFEEVCSKEKHAGRLPGYGYVLKFCLLGILILRDTNLGRKEGRCHLHLLALS